MLKKIVQVCLVLALAWMTQSCIAGAGDSQPTSIHGTIRVAGNEPFAQVIIRTISPQEKDAKDRDIVLIGPLVAELRRDFRGKVVTLEGQVCKSPSPQFDQCFKPSRITVE